MMKHDFILQPKNWVGEGTISLNMVEEQLNFLTKWNVTHPDAEGKITTLQEIQIVGMGENMKNELLFFDFTENGFSVALENVNIGKVLGTGVYDDKVIAWEFRGNEMNFEGFETYVLQQDGSYLVHAEYMTSDQFRTQIQGKIWLQQEEKELSKGEEDVP